MLSQHEELKNIVDHPVEHAQQTPGRSQDSPGADRSSKRLAGEHTGYDPIYGARPLKRLIQKDIEIPLALHILQGDFVDGDRIVVDTNGEQLNFKREGSLVTVS